MYHKAIRQEGAVYPSCLDFFLSFCGNDKKKIEGAFYKDWLKLNTATTCNKQGLT